MPQLAIQGGKPIRNKQFPRWPFLHENQLEFLQSAWESQQWGIRSPHVQQFEERFAEFQNAKYALATSHGTASLWIALKACGIKAGDEVILPAYTFVATASAVMMANAIPVIVDIDPNTYNIDPSMVEHAITERTRAVIPVHIAGQPADMEAISRIAQEHDLHVIEDAAQAHGAEWQGRRVGAIGKIGTFSFQSSKNMTAGEGGALVTDSQEHLDRCFSYYNCGRIREGAWYEHRVLGSNLRMTAWSAAILLAQFATIEQDMETRDRNAHYLDQRLCEIPGILPLTTHPNVTRHSRHLYIFRYDAEEFEGLPREKFLEALQAEGVPAYKGYTPLYREAMFAVDPLEYPWLEGRDYGRLELPVCEKACEHEAVWLAQNALLGGEDDMEDIVHAVAKIHQNLGELTGKRPAVSVD